MEQNGIKMTGNAVKRNRHSISLEQKLEIIRRTEGGERLTDVGKHYQLNTSTIKTILNNAKKIKHIGLSATATSASKITRIRSVRMEKMERMLTVWVQDQAQRNLPLTTALIMCKARSIHDILKRDGDCAEAEKPFTASKGWFERFKRRNNIQSIRFSSNNNSNQNNNNDSDRLSREKLGAEETARAEFLSRFKNALFDGKYPPPAVFNFNECGLFWKRLPRHRNAVEEDYEDEEFHSELLLGKERVSVLLGSNASGDFKMKPLVVYHCENPPTLKGYSKENLPVIWKWNREASVTADIFQQWFVSYFCPSVIAYCERRNLEKRILLLLDNSACHPQNLDILQSALKIELLFFPSPDTNNYFQPMDQGVTRLFQASYLKKSVSQMSLNSQGKSEKLVWKRWFEVKKCIENVGLAWDEVSGARLNAAWHKVWPEAVNSFVDFYEVLRETVSRVVEACGRVRGLEGTEAADVQRLLTAHGRRLSEEELNELEERRTRADRSRMAEPDRNLSAKSIAQAVNQIANALELLVEQDPNLERSSAVKRAVMRELNCYTEILHEKRKKMRNDAYV